jgi:hypothetical protein
MHDDLRWIRGEPLVRAVRGKVGVRDGHTIRAEEGNESFCERGHGVLL